ncbi:MAG: radical SAM protein [Deltaproteobacteria bacterium]|nr:radical SAM protein [Deltaproteobacteria bacterium]MBW2306230.1 radical SAM protein [Deltaproteobacteria bacterium]
MRVLLLNLPPKGLISSRGKIHNRRIPPLEFLTTAAMLEEQRVDVRLADLAVQPLDKKDAARLAGEADRVFVTTSPYHRWQCPSLDIEEILENMADLPRHNLFVLGAHGSVFPEAMLRVTGARAVIRGEPEETVVDLCQSLDLQHIPGVTWQEGDVVHSTPDRPPADLMSLPVPAFHHLDPRLYRYELLGNNLTIFEGSRGCPYVCQFCLKSMFGHGYRKKTGQRLIQEVETAVRTTGVRRAYFFDLFFTGNDKAVRELCRHMINQRIDLTWSCQTRPDRVDAEMLVLMRKAGCRLIHYGIESGSQRLLDACGKNIRIKQIEEGVAMTHRAGIETACFFMIGLPGETQAESRETVRLARRLRPTYASFHVVIPYPGTPLHHKFVHESEPDAERTGNGTKSAGGWEPHSSALEHMIQCWPPPVSLGDQHPNELQTTARKAFLHYYLHPSYAVSRLQAGNWRSLAGQLRLFMDFVR